MSAHSELAGKVAVVTGATRQAGIGAAIARELVAAGASVFIAHFREYDQRQTWGIAPGEPESILATLGARSAGAEIDLSKSAAAVELFDRAISRFGRVDVLVNNAAYWERGGIAEITADQLDRHYAVNLRATVLLCGEFVRRRPPGGGGRIINITSGQGLGPMPGELAYAVTKAGLDALTLSLSAALKELGVTVNAVDPGPTDTGWIPDDLRASLVATASRIGAPEDVAAVVRLLSRDVAATVTGRIIRLQHKGVVESLTTELRELGLHDRSATA
jgi:3-oxoacyl-[acyl-carrier protein] reductase